MNDINILNKYSFNSFYLYQFLSIIVVSLCNAVQYDNYKRLDGCFCVFFYQIKVKIYTFWTNAFIIKLTVW